MIGFRKGTALEITASKQETSAALFSWLIALLALALLAGLLLILTIPQISMEGETAEAGEPLQAVPAEG